MSDVFVGGRSRDMAILLLAAAAELELESRVVRTQRDGYLVPEEVAELASAGPAEEDPGQAVPAESEKKPVWVDYAVSLGADREEVEGMTKAEIINEYKE